MVTSKRGIEFNIDDIATDLNGKADVDGTNATFPHIVETYHSGTEWYRVWSDGWCEQGGEIDGISSAYRTVNLLKNFVDTNYTIVTSQQSSSSSYPNSTIIGYYNKQVGSFQLGTRYVSANETPAKISWQAKGYIS